MAQNINQSSINFSQLQKLLDSIEIEPYETAPEIPVKEESSLEEEEDYNTLTRRAENLRERFEREQNRIPSQIRPEYEGIHNAGTRILRDMSVKIKEESKESENQRVIQEHRKVAHEQTIETYTKEKNRLNKIMD